MSTGLNLIESASYDSSALPSLRRWKPATLGRRCDMRINGCDIRFMHRTLTEMKYMHYTRMFREGIRVIPLLATQCISPERVHIATLFADY